VASTWTVIEGDQGIVQPRRIKEGDVPSVALQFTAHPFYHDECGAQLDTVAGRFATALARDG
jgi:hypothetical protein